LAQENELGFTRKRADRLARPSCLMPARASGLLAAAPLPEALRYSLSSFSTASVSSLPRRFLYLIFPFLSRRKVAGMELTA